MAEAVVSGFLQLVIEKLASPILEQCKLFWGVDKEMENLRSKLSTIEAVLADAEEQPVKSKALQNWLGKLKDVVYDAEDILEEFTNEAEAEPKVEAKRRKLQIGTFFSASNPLVSRSNMADKIKEIGQRLDAIAEERSQFHLKEVERVSDIRGREPTDSFVIESDVYGRAEDKRRVMELLISNDNGEDVTVIPIVGMGGLGKTTLAQLAYNDMRVATHFVLRMWVCVSDDFSVSRVTKDIIESATHSKCDLQSMDQLQHCLRELLREKKFLLVLDDVWEENPVNWDRLKQFLRGGATGSKIIITTRSEKVALIMGTLPPHHLRILSDDDCWSLFKQRAFGHGRQEHPNLIMLGKEIVKKCGGVPLAAKALGSLMHFKTEEREWLFVKESDFWNLPEEDNHILPALRLSYYHLPPHLKQCFAYCSIFPKDHIIWKEKLIRLWMAEGFIKSSGRSQQMEDVGGEYFNNLLWRSFFQDVKKNEDGNIVRCKMHDFVHDLACSVAGNECSIVQVKNAVSIPNVSRRLLLECGNNRSDLTDPEPSRRANHLRTLLLLESPYFSISHNVLEHFMFLRVLDLTPVKVTTELLVSISRLKHLRYLQLSITEIQAFPESICTLYHLQTLKLSGCNKLAELPRDMSKMTSLRHLEIDFCHQLTHMPANMGELKFLQTLPIFIVGKDSGCGIRELKGLNLGGKLTIENLENVMCAAEAQEANLKDKRNLCDLRFSWGQDIDLQLEGNVEQTLEGLRPHQNLKRLTVEKYMGVRFPHWMSSSLLPNLIEVSLLNCRRCEQLPPLGHLPFLNVLVIRGMNAVKSIGKHFYGDDITDAFPSLKQLTIQDMPNLEEWSGSNGRVLPCLNQLTVWGCPKLTTLPCLPSLKELELTYSNEMLLGSVANLSSLSSLRVEGFKELRSLPDGLFENHTHLLRLEIRECPKLEYVSRELGNLAALESLSIWGCSMLVSLPEESQNLTSLHQLSIVMCNGLTSLRLQGLSSLESLYISGCSMLVSLPEESQNLTSLHRLEIYGCNGLTSLRLQGLSSLEYLSISGCNMLVSLPEELQNLTSLKKLYINECNGLTSLRLQGLSSLQHHTIMHCQSLTSLIGGLQHLTALQDLFIINCPELAYLPEGMQHLTALQDLYINNCPKLAYLPEGMQHLTSLRGLTIMSCQKLTCLPEGLRHVTTLEDLSIGGMTPPEWIGNLSSLRSLKIVGGDKLMCLPSWLQLLKNLQILKISYWQILTALPEWIGNLSSLRSLEIDRCPQLEYLPSGLQLLTNLQRLTMEGCPQLECLPSGLQLLTNLQSLTIIRCPQLEKRCEKEKGEDWHYISHIPRIQIGKDFPI